MADGGIGKKRSLESNPTCEERETKVKRDADIKDLSGFNFAEVLSEDAKSKTLILHLKGI